jgi:hypothetical protein
MAASPATGGSSLARQVVLDAHRSSGILAGAECQDAAFFVSRHTSGLLLWKPPRTRTTSSPAPLLHVLGEAGTSTGPRAPSQLRPLPPATAAPSPDSRPHNHGCAMDVTSAGSSGSGRLHRRNSLRDGGVAASPASGVAALRSRGIGRRDKRISVENNH